MAVEIGDEKPKKETKVKSQEEVVAVSNNNQVSIDASLLAKLIERSTSNGDSSNEIKELVKELKKKDLAEIYQADPRYRSSDDLDPEDHIEEGIPFYTFSNGYFISDDKRKGKPVLTPFGNTLKFTFLHATKKSEGKNAIIEPVSMYVSYSKKEVEWLKNHSLFGIKFFVDLKSVTNVDSRKALKLSRQMSMVKQMSAPELAKACRERGLSMAIEADEMRYALASYLSEEELRRENEENSVKAINSIREKLVIK